jgi:radical SAM-linked protein
MLRLDRPFHDPSQVMITATKLRLRFAKRGDLRLVSHLDDMRCLERMVRRSGIPVARRQGFTPRPKITFALPLGLGIEGLDEVVDFELSQPEEPQDVLARLAAVSPAGLEWLGAQAVPPGSPPPRPVAVEYRVWLPSCCHNQTRTALRSLLSSTTAPFIRRRHDSDREQTIDLRPFLLDAELTEEGMLRARFRVSPDGSVRPEEFLECLGLRDLLDHGSVLARTQVELADTGTVISA